MYFIQIVAIVFALFAFSRVVLRLREKKLSIFEFSFWTIVWLALVLVAIFPEALSVVALRIGIQSGIGLVVYTGMILLFYLLFRVYVKIDTMEQEITALTRAITLSRAQGGGRDAGHVSKKARRQRR
jgi:small membrane protein